MSLQTNRLITLPLKDPECREWLKGTNPQFAAVTRDVFGADLGRLRLTFELVPWEKIVKPKGLFFFKALLRPSLFGLLLLPVLGTLVMSSKHFVSEINSSSTLKIALLFFALLFLHLGLIWHQEYRDHLNGVDLWDRERGSGVLRLGWIPAYRLQQGSFLSFALAFVCGFFIFPLNEAYWMVGALALVMTSLFAVNFMPERFRRLGVLDSIIFWLYGPVLVAGTLWAFQIEPKLFHFIWAWWCGFATMVVLQIRQFESFFRQKGLVAKSYVFRFSFDKTKRLIFCEVMLLFIVYPLMLSLLHWGYGVFGALLALYFYREQVSPLMDLSSPLSSKLQFVGKNSLYRLLVMQMIPILLWIFA